MASKETPHTIASSSSWRCQKMLPQGNQMDNIQEGLAGEVSEKIPNLQVLNNLWIELTGEKKEGKQVKKTYRQQ